MRSTRPPTTPHRAPDAPTAAADRADETARLCGGVAIVCDDLGRPRACSGNAGEVLGRSPEAVVADWAALVGPAERRRLDRARAIGLPADGPALAIRRPGGEPLAVSTRIVPGPGEVVVVLRPAPAGPTASPDAEFFEALLECTGDFVVVADPDGRLRYVSPTTRRVLGWTGADVRTLAANLTHPDDADLLDAATAAARSTPAGREQVRVRLLGADGAWRPMDVTVLDRTDDPRVRGVVTVGRLGPAEPGRSDGIALVDLAFGDRLRRARGEERSVTVVAVRLDGLAAVREQAGDEVADLVAGSTVDALRQLAPGDHLVVRAADDRVVLVTAPLDCGSVALAHRAEAAIRRRIGPGLPALRVAVGATTARPDDSEAEALGRADRACERSRLRREPVVG